MTSELFLPTLRNSIYSVASSEENVSVMDDFLELDTTRDRPSIYVVRFSLQSPILDQVMGPIGRRPNVIINHPIPKKGETPIAREVYHFNFDRRREANRLAGMALRQRELDVREIPYMGFVKDKYDNGAYVVHVETKSIGNLQARLKHLLSLK